ncbi:PaaI family thioesterase [Pseudonocardia sp. CA-107938]|uniref:PaaI family thioesterase n=1 Tax=Pseudonocardia sp. CA-107938 TaxID=3240021 RepID=UPI003D942186
MTSTQRPQGFAEMPRTWRRSGPAEYPEMIEALRTLEDRVAEAAPPEELIREVRAELEALSARLAEHAVPESDRLAGSVFTLPGRAQTLVPVVHIDELVAEPLPVLRGRVTFRPHQLGGNGAVHGGVIPLVFDDVLGVVAHAEGRLIARTAYLHTEYRAIAPVGKELQVRAWIEREEGRKRFCAGSLHDGDTLCAEITGLFVQLRPGQP